MLHDDAADADSNHDFGRDILPKLAGRAEMFAYDFQTNRSPASRRTPRLLARRGDHRRLLRGQHGPPRREPGAQPLQPRVAAAHHQLSRTRPPSSPSTTTTAAARRSTASSRAAASSPGGMVRNSVLGRGVRVHSGALVEDCVILDNCDIGRRAKIRRAILDKNVRIAGGRRDRLRPGARPAAPSRDRSRASWWSRGCAPRWTSPRSRSEPPRPPRSR